MTLPIIPIHRSYNNPEQSRGFVTFFDQEAEFLTTSKRYLYDTQICSMR